MTSRLECYGSRLGTAPPFSYMHAYRSRGDWRGDWTVSELQYLTKLWGDASLPATFTYVNRVQLVGTTPMGGAVCPLQGNFDSWKPFVISYEPL